MTSVTAEQNLNIKTTTGSVALESVDAGDIKIKTDTGKVTGSLRSMKYFKVKTDTGKIQLPDNADGTEFSGSCDIETDTGNIIITVES